MKLKSTSMGWSQKQKPRSDIIIVLDACTQCIPQSIIHHRREPHIPVPINCSGTQFHNITFGMAMIHVVKAASPILARREVVVPNRSSPVMLAVDPTDGAMLAQLSYVRCGAHSSNSEMCCG
jgi:hypothetical protein